jgi:hypothetical protein
MLLKAELYNPAQPEQSVSVSFPIKDYDTIYAALSEYGMGDVINRDCRIKSLESDYPVLDSLIGTDVNIDEMDYLAKRLDSFWEREYFSFVGAAAARGISDIESLINLTFCSETVTVITNFDNLESVGRVHFLNVRGGSCQKSEMEGVDFEKVAKDLINSGTGVITPYGLVFDNGMELERMYQGREFPAYLYEPEILAVLLTHPSDPEIPATCLCLPMPIICIERQLVRGGWTEDFTDMKVEIENFVVPDDVFKNMNLESESPYVLNDMAAALSKLDNKNWAKMLAIAEFAEPQNISELTILAENYESFDFYPNVSDAAEYGHYMIAESEHFEYDENLEDFYDFKGYGEWRLSQEQGRFLDSGYICYTGETPIEELMGRIDEPITYDNIRINDELIIEDDHINAITESWFDVDARFGTVTRDTDSYVNVYADYFPKDDRLDVCYVVAHPSGDDEDAVPVNDLAESEREAFMQRMHEAGLDECIAEMEAEQSEDGGMTMT